MPSAPSTTIMAPHNKETYGQAHAGHATPPRTAPAPRNSHHLSPPSNRHAACAAAFARPPASPGFSGTFWKSTVGGVSVSTRPRNDLTPLFQMSDATDEDANVINIEAPRFSLWRDVERRDYARICGAPPTWTAKKNRCGRGYTIGAVLMFVVR